MDIKASAKETEINLLFKNSGIYYINNAIIEVLVNKNLISGDIYSII